MRQWELIGITDSEPWWTPPKPTEPETELELEPDIVFADEPGPSVFFWSTDQSLRLRTVSRSAAQTIGKPMSWCEGRDLLDIFGMEGSNLAILEAHVEALDGGEGTFMLHGEQGSVECHVAPTHGTDDRVSGTFCIATSEPAGEGVETERERVQVALIR